jgi:hypothetical protein
MVSIKNRYFWSSIGMLVYASLSSIDSFAEESSVAQPPPEIVIDAPSPTQSPVKQEIESSETVTIYHSKVLPGFRPCTTEDYRNQDTDPVACQDEEASRVISTRESQSVSDDLIVEDNAVPQGNIFKLDFERFKKNK